MVVYLLMERVDLIVGDILLTKLKQKIKSNSIILNWTVLTYIGIVKKIYKCGK